MFYVQQTEEKYFLCILYCCISVFFFYFTILAMGYVLRSYKVLKSEHPALTALQLNARKYECESEKLFRAVCIMDNRGEQSL